MVRRLATTGAALAIVAAGACRSPAGGAMTGRWIGTDGNLRVVLTVTQRADSVVGSGKYTLAHPADLGCGGETIPDSGPVSLTGKISLAGQAAGPQVSGQLRFVAADWTPPFIGTFVGPDSVAGGLMSVDRGRCPLSFVRER